MFNFISAFTSNLIYSLIVPGIVIGLLCILASMFIPIMYRMYAIVVGLLLVVFFVFQSGRYTEQNKYEKQALANQVTIAELAKKSAEVNTVIVTKYVDRISVIEKIKEVKTNVYVNKEADRKCVIDTATADNLTRLLNSAGQGTIPEPARIVDATSNPTPESINTLNLSDIAANTKLNYANSAANRIQLESLQEWIREQQKIYK